MFGNLMDKMQEAQAAMQNTKDKLNGIEIEESSIDNNIFVKINGNKKLLNIHINDKVLENKEQLENSIVETINKAFDKADKITKDEITNFTSGVLPNMKNLFG